jgi:hypothetical protein
VNDLNNAAVFGENSDGVKRGAPSELACVESSGGGRWYRSDGTYDAGLDDCKLNLFFPDGETEEVALTSPIDEDVLAKGRAPCFENEFGEL